MPASALGTVVDFEAFDDATSLATHVPGAAFANAVVLTAGVGLNELEFPPASSVDVASDDGGPVTVTFAGPVRTVVGFVTYRLPLTIRALDAAGATLAVATSRFASNGALTGAIDATARWALQGDGRGWTIGASAAIAGASASALAPLGLQVEELPVTAGRLFRLLDGR